MRQKADKLEKGKWYADTAFDLPPEFLRYHSIAENIIKFSDQKGDDPYLTDYDGGVSIYSTSRYWYLPTPEDIEKYNLNETE